MSREFGDSVLRQHGRLAPPRPDDELVTASVATDGTAIALWASPHTARALLATARVAYAPVVLAQPVVARVTLQRPNEQPDTIVIGDLRLMYPHVALLPAREVLIVGARCAWTPEHVEPNAAVYDENGNIIGSGIVGDGVRHVRTTPSGAIWIGYNDEGIFGNFGWGVPGPEPIGHQGLMRFSPGLEPQWGLPHGLPDMLDVADLEAINVVGETVWICSYVDYPIVRIRRDEPIVWRTEGMPVSQILVEDDRVALIGPPHVAVGRLGSDGFAPTATTALPALVAAGDTRPYLIGQGPMLHVIAPDGAWSITDLDALEATVA